MNDIIILAVQLGITVAAFVVGKYLFPNIPKSVTDKLTTLEDVPLQERIELMQRKGLKRSGNTGQYLSIPLAGIHTELKRCNSAEGNSLSSRISGVRI